MQTSWALRGTSQNRACTSQGEWPQTPITLANKRDRRQKLVDETEDEIGDAVRAAFDEGVLVGPIKEAVGRSGSRVYQLKFALRDQEEDTQNAVS